MRPTVSSVPENRTLRGSANQKAKGKQIMGDKSPKSVHKQAVQKQLKANAANQTKQQALIAKQNPAKIRLK